MYETKPRTVYLLKRTDKADDGTDIYVGSTSMNLKYRLHSHRCSASYLWKYGGTKLYKKMREVGVDNWEIVPLLSFTCDKNTILEFEKEWIRILKADLNKNSPIGLNMELNKETRKRVQARYYHKNIQNKIHHCDVCDKSFRCNYFLQEHFESLKHQYAYLNSLD